MRHADFYVTAATVIPVLYAILIFQTRALIPANRKQRGTRVALGKVTALIFVLFPLYAEGVAMDALYSNADAHSSRVVVLLAIVLLLSSLLGMMVALLQGENIFRGPGS